MHLNANVFSFYLIPPVLSFIFGGYLAVSALSAAQGARRGTMILFAVVCVWYSLLAPVFIAHHLIADQTVILAIERGVHFFYVYLPLILVAFFHRLLGIHRPKVLWACFATSFMISLSTHSDAYFSGLYKFSWGFIAKGGIAFELFALYGLSAMGYSIYCFIIAS